jgi:hypothetical protein
MVLVACFGATRASAASSAAWKVTMTPVPTNFAPGSTSEYLVSATNVGGKASAGPIVLKATLDAELTLVGITAANADPGSLSDPTCTKATLTCETSEVIHSGNLITMTIKASLPVGAPEDTLVSKASIVEGGGDEVSGTAPTPVGPDPVPFDFLQGTGGFSAPTTSEDGQATSLAGAHPYQVTLDAGFPTEKLGNDLTGSGHLRNLTIDLPRGFVGNPTATAELCTEAELTSEASPGCPDASQVGVSVVTTGLAPGAVVILSHGVYNMVPPPGAAAELGFEVGGAGVFIHAIVGVRTEGEYNAYAATDDILALGTNPVYNVQVQTWGEPSSEAHDSIRGACESKAGTCPVDPQNTVFLAMPGDCTGQPLRFEGHANSWEEPSQVKPAEYQSAGLTENPVSIEGCNELEFNPTIRAQTTTNVSDSPSGLDFDLHQPQQTDGEDPKTGLEARYTANSKDVTINFPAGLAVNASSAGGLDACSISQIGLMTAVGATPIHFSDDPAQCPDAAKLGEVEVISPLLGQFNESHKAVRDPEGHAIPEPLHGSIYLAKPFANPFGSLIAVYITIEDERTGIVAKIAGEVEANPQTGQLSTTVRENPELPLEDVKVQLFKGPRAGLQTPPICATHTTTSDLVPWTSPEGPNSQPTDSFQTTAAPGGGPCPAAIGQAANAPSFSAGTISPAAGAYSPLLFKLSREDGSQRLAGLEATMPPGIAAKFVGVARCTDGEIAAAQARSQPNQGAVELASPSCPAASEVGTVDVAAGAGPTPFHVQGRAYLAGPYKGAPLSLAIITPAIAGPFDLGVVTVRTAVYIDPTTAQARAVSDPLPQILQGIPVDVRSVQVKADRPNFILNPTSCNPMSFAGTATSASGLPAPLSARFQVGNCSALPFKPKLFTRLFGPIHRGGHPRFRAVLTAKPGEAGIASMVVALPHSEFIDQSHFRTICTRVQFAASQCPPGSIYGHVQAFSPLLDFPLEGPVYLRSSSHELPDVVAALRGPASMPIAIDAVARVDSVNGGVRFSLPTIPDAPISKAIVTAQGGKTGLFQNSTNICKGAHRVGVKMEGQNGKAHDFNPLLQAKCPKNKRPKRSGQHR